VKAHDGDGVPTSPRAASRTALREREDAVVARLDRLAPDLDGEPSPDFRAATRARLVAMAAVRSPEPAPVSPLKRLLASRAADAVRPAWRRRLTAAFVGAAAVVTALATVVALSADAQPGDVLYGVKRGTEQTQLALAGEARGRTLLGFASTRLVELRDIVGDEPDAALVADTLATMDAQTVDGVALLAQRAVEQGDAASLDELAGWTAGQAEGLDALAPRIPAAAHDDIGDSGSLLAQIDQRVEALRTAVACPAGPAVAGSDVLGPLPVQCAAGSAQQPAAPATPGAPVSDRPATSTPGSTAPGSDATTGGGTGSTDGEAPSAPSSGAPTEPTPSTGSDSVVDVPGLPLPSLPLPSLPLPTLPGLPGQTAASTATGDASTNSSGGADPGGSGVGESDPGGGGGGLGVCLPPLLTVGDCA
jgi:hypothetical protein